MGSIVEERINRLEGKLKEIIQSESGRTEIGKN